MPRASNRARSRYTKDFDDDHSAVYDPGKIKTTGRMLQNP